MTKWKIKVPGSTANLGPGFDSIGLAVNRYVTLVAEPSQVWQFSYNTPGYEDIPTDKENLIYKAFAFTLHTLEVKEEHGRACQVGVESELPLARGLGSSAAAIVAGIELANLLYGLNLSKEQKVRIASLYEGHPDNVAASVYGGLTVGTHGEKETTVIPCGAIDVDLLILVPNHELLTMHSRGVLPERLDYRNAVEASSIANVFIAALLKGDLMTAGKMMIKDLFHQPYRKQMVPHLEKLFDYVTDSDFYGVALSGAGPAVICFVKSGIVDKKLSVLQKQFPDFEIEYLEVDEQGLTVN